MLSAMLQAMSTVSMIPSRHVDGMRSGKSLDNITFASDGLQM